MTHPDDHLVGGMDAPTAALHDANENGMAALELASQVVESTRIRKAWRPRCAVDEHRGTEVRQARR